MTNTVIRVVQLIGLELRSGARQDNHSAPNSPMREASEFDAHAPFKQQVCNDARFPHLQSASCDVRFVTHELDSQPA